MSNTTPDQDGAYPRDASIHELFLQQAQRTPDAPAVTDPAGTITYAQLAERSARLAARIAQFGAGPGDLVAVQARPGIDWIVADLAVLRAGAAFLPISPDDPQQRVEFLLDDAGVRLVLGDDERSGVYAGRTQLSIAADHSGNGVLPDRVPATDAAYVMYTSGSTGRPKGVVVCHRNVVRLVTGTGFVTFSSAMRLLQTGAVSFDATTFEVWGPLVNGGTVVVPEPDVIFDAERMAAALTGERITTMWLTSPLFSRLAGQDPATFATLRELVVGGDVVDGRRVADVLAVAPGLRVVNGYGPTENTTFSTTHHITVADTSGDIPIGRPIAHSTAYVLTEAGDVAADGEPGELHVGGDGVALGYLNQSELTRRAFLPDPFAPGGRMYRTGDLVRRRADGVIEFLGRADGQVKIRGFRIEPGEIEAVLRDHPAVADVIVLARVRSGGEPLDKFLCAYLTTKDPVDAAELREHLAHRVPRHLIPGHLVILDELPLNAHGKVDRNRLPDPEDLHDLDVEYVAARDEVEQRLVALWEQQLPGTTVGVLDSVFDHGLDSLGTATLAAQVSREFAVSVSMTDVFRNPSVEELAALLAERGTTVTPPAEAPHRLGRVPLTPQQHPLYVAQVKDPQSVQYNVPIVLDLPADTDTVRLARAWQALVRRHDALRTSFDDGPVQVVHAEIATDVPVLETPIGAAGLVQPFDLARAPLARARVHRFDGRTVLVVELHHLVVDGLSLMHLFTDLDALYHGVELPPVTCAYADYTAWVTEGPGRQVAEEQRAYWDKAFDDWQPPAELPTDRPRPAVRTNAGAVHTFRIGEKLTAALRASAAQHATTMFAPLAAAYAVFLSAITGQDDVTVGVPAAGRSMPGSDDAVGMFVNTVCLRLRPYAGIGFAELVEQVSTTARQALANQDFPLADIAAAVEVVRVPGRNAVFDTLLALQSGALHQTTFLGSPIELRPLFPGQTMFDLNMQVYERPSDLDVSWEYATELFDAATVAAFAGLFLDILTRALADPALPVAELARTAEVVPAPADDATGIDFDL